MLSRRLHKNNMLAEKETFFCHQRCCFNSHRLFFSSGHDTYENSSFIKLDSSVRALLIRVRFSVQKFVWRNYVGHNVTNWITFPSTEMKEYHFSYYFLLYSFLHHNFSSLMNVASVVYSFVQPVSCDFKFFYNVTI